MKSVLLRKVVYRLPGKWPRPVWAFVLAQQEGLSLLFVPKPNDNSHTLALATEDPASGQFEDAKVSRITLATKDLEDAGERLEALGEGLIKVDFRRLFKMDED